ncbi:MAG: competence type IV pilus minor pilin ComGD [Tuberibacillus sp.]
MAIRNSKGFTLLETIIVLAIATIVIPITFKQYAMVHERQHLNGFIGELQELIYYAQMTAITKDNYVNVAFNNTTHHVDVLLGAEPLKTLEAEEGIFFEKGSHNLTLKYSPKGTLVNQAGSLYIKTEHFSKKIVFLLGQGRFYVENM